MFNNFWNSLQNDFNVPLNADIITFVPYIIIAIIISIELYMDKLAKNRQTYFWEFWQASIEWDMSIYSFIVTFVTTMIISTPFLLVLLGLEMIDKESPVFLIVIAISLGPARFITRLQTGMKKRKPSSEC